LGDTKESELFEMSKKFRPDYTETKTMMKRYYVSSKLYHWADFDLSQLDQSIGFLMVYDKEKKLEKEHGEDKGAFRIEVKENGM